MGKAMTTKRRKQTKKKRNYKATDATRINIDALKKRVKALQVSQSAMALDLIDMWQHVERQIGPIRTPKGLGDYWEAVVKKGKK